MEQLAESMIVQFGALSVLVVVLIAMIICNARQSSAIQSQHITERIEWRKQAATQHDEVLEVAKESNKALAIIQTLVESMR